MAKPKKTASPKPQASAPEPPAARAAVPEVVPVGTVAELEIEEHVATEPAPPKAAEPVIHAGLRITARREGFRRAGRAWSKSAIDVRVADFTLDQIEQLLAEPLLDVTEIGIPAE